MLELGIPVGAGRDATRVASYNPWVSLYWLVTGRTVGGASMYPDNSRLSRQEALQLYTQGSSWFSSESGKKGAISERHSPIWSRSLTTTSPWRKKKSKASNPSSLSSARNRPRHRRIRTTRVPPLPVLPERSPVKVFGSYGAAGYAKGPRAPECRSRINTARHVTNAAAITSVVSHIALYISILVT